MRLLLAPLLLAPVLAAQTAPKLELKVLYAGVPDDPRTEQWREFLAPRTKGFTVLDVEQLGDDTVTDADIVILDCPDPIVRNAAGNPERIKVPRPRNLTAAFGHPTIVVGGMALITDHLELKSNWL
ncbi:MAG TPA: hypothetical protein VFZ65_07870 [Planctomycetota bacterium]|nr:hypothetical protein [Planctomycetota bacterium]